MKLDVKDWKEFKLENLFDSLEKGKCNNASVLKKAVEDGINYIGAKRKDNGVMSYVERKADLISKGNCIIMIGQGEGSSGYAIYMDKDFIGSNSLNIGYADWINFYTGHFIVTCMCLEYPKYSFGRSWTGTKLKETIIKLPICKDDKGSPIIDRSCKFSVDGYMPDFKWMEEYIKSIKSQPLKTFNKKNSSINSFSMEKWKDFLIGDLFDIKTGKDFIYGEAIGNDFCVIGHGKDDNGVACKTEEVPEYELQDCSKTLSLGHIGNFIAYVHPKDFYLGTRTKALIVKEECINKKALLFLATVINKEAYKYVYGRVGSDKFPKTYIKLPICYEEDGITPKIDNTHKYSKEGFIPDFEWMSNYMGKLPYGDRV